MHPCVRFSLGILTLRNCLNSDHNIVEFTTRYNSIFSTHTCAYKGPIGRNGQFCCIRYNKLLSQIRRSPKRLSGIMLLHACHIFTVYVRDTANV